MSRHVRTLGWRWRVATVVALLVATVCVIATGVIPRAHAADGSGFGPGTAAIAPGDAAGNPDALVVGVSCSAPGDCGAIGFYGNASGQQGLLLTEADGVWAPAVKLTLPSTASSSPSVLLTTISCASEGNCLAAGSYSDTVNGFTTVVVAESGGVWGSGAELTPPAGAPANTSVQIGAVSCPSADTCTAVGDYGSGEGMMATETDGTWAPSVKAALPSGTDNNPNVKLNAVSCPSPGNCTAVGYDATSGLLVTETDGAWATAVAAPAPVNASDVRLGSVSCTAPGECGAAGTYQGTQNNRQIMLLTQSAGTWSGATAAQLPAGSAATTSTSLNAISCTSPRNCTAVGTYADGASHQQGVLLTETSGVWAAGTEAVLPADAVAAQNVSVVSVSCPAAGTCTAVGSYIGPAGLEGLILSETSGAWSDPTAPTLPSDAGSAHFSTLASVSCTAPGACGAVGNYDSSTAMQGLLVDAVPPPPPDTTSSTTTTQTTTTTTTTTTTDTSATTPTTTTTTTTTTPSRIIAPVDIAAPTIRGLAVQGQTLTASRDTWLNGPTAFANRWERCNRSGRDCTPINVASATNYTLTTTDVGHTLRVAETATNAGGSTTATSPQTATIAPAVSSIAPALGRPTTQKTSARLPVTCRANPGQRCSVTLTLTIKHGRRTVTLGTTTQSLTPGQHRTLTVSLNKAGRRLASRRGALHLTLTLTEPGQKSSHRPIAM